jgi:hypothetical protein
LPRQSGISILERKMQDLSFDEISMVCGADRGDATAGGAVAGAVFGGAAAGAEYGVWGGAGGVIAGAIIGGAIGYIAYSMG